MKGSLAKTLLDIRHRTAGRWASDHAAGCRRRIGFSCNSGAVGSARDRTGPAARVPNRSRTPAARGIVDARCRDSRGHDRGLAPRLAGRRAVDSSPRGHPRRGAGAPRARRLVDRRSSIRVEARRGSPSSESLWDTFRALDSELRISAQPVPDGARALRPVTAKRRSFVARRLPVRSV